MDYKLNKELTMELFDKCNMSDYIEKGACYSNVFKAMTSFELCNGFMDNKYKIALAYISNELGIWLRHAVVVTEDGDILDFTLARNGGDFYMTNYEIVKVFDCKEYNNYIDDCYDEKDCSYQCDLPNLKEEHEFYFNKLREQMFFQLSEYDYFTYIIPVIEKYGYPDDVKRKYEDLQKELQGIKGEITNGKRD